MLQPGGIPDHVMDVLGDKYANYDGVLPAELWHFLQAAAGEWPAMWVWLVVQLLPLQHTLTTQPTHTELAFGLTWLSGCLNIYNTAFSSYICARCRTAGFW